MIFIPTWIPKLNATHIMTTQKSSSKPSPEALYQLCTSSNLTDVQEGFRILGDYLFWVVRNQLNRERYDNMFVQDRVQVALQNIWSAMEQGKGPNNPSAFLSWSTTVALRRCIDRLRYESRRKTEELSIEIEESIGDISLNLEHQILIDEQRLELLTSLNRHPHLSRKSKLILIEGFFLEQTDSELAQLLATKQTNVRVIRHRNLEKLKHDTNFLDQLRS